MPFAACVKQQKSQIYKLIIKNYLAFMSLKMRPILNTLTTRRRVGDTGKSIIMSSMRMPRIEASTSKKSNTFQGTVK